VAGQIRPQAPGEGLAVAAALLVQGGLTLLAPAYFDAAGWRETGWHIAGAILAVIAVAGAITELAKVSRHDFVGDFGLALVCLGVAVGASVLAEGVNLGSPWTGLVKSFATFMLFFAIYGAFRGVAIAVHVRESKPRTRDSSRASDVTAIIVAAIGLATAGLSVWEAFIALPPTRP
jgi:hypothetical protein